MFCLKKEKYHMTNFFIYLEKVLTDVGFFGNNYIIGKIPDFYQKNSSIRNAEFMKIKDDLMNAGHVYVYHLKNNPHFNFKIGNIIYELAFITDYNQSMLKISNKLQAIEHEVDTKVAGRYGVAFYPRDIPGGNKYGNIQLKPQDSKKLFDYLRTCAESSIVNKSEFYFDGAYTDKELKIINKLEKFSDKMKQQISTIGKDRNKLYEMFLKILQESDIVLKTPILYKIKKIIDKTKLGNILKKITFIMRDELNINFNVREKYFVKLLEKEGIKAKIGNKYTRTIFFEI